MLSYIDTDLIMAFVTIVDTQSFTRTGEKLYRTQSAISMQMKRLEQIIGKDLFDHSIRGIRLTPEGAIFLQYARRILSLHEEAKLRMAQVNLKGVVRLGTSDDYASMYLPIVFEHFSRMHPGVRIDIVCGNGDRMLDRLNSNDIDVALVASHAGNGAGVTVRKEQLVWISSSGGRAHMLDPLPLTAFPEGCVCRNVMVTALERIERKWWIAFSSDNIAAIHSAVRSDLAISAVEAGLLPEGVRVLSEKEGFPPLPEIAVVIHHNLSKATNMTKALAHLMLEQLSQERPTASAIARLVGIEGGVVSGGAQP